MVKEFEILSQSERELMYSLPIYVAVLIAGADGDIDNREVSRANNLANDKLKNARKDLISYYNEANENFEDKLKMAIANLPSGTTERQKLLVEKLKSANEVFDKLQNKYAISLYSSLKEIAKKIAEASGGVFGYMAIDFEESKLIELKMIKDPSTRK
ncbi:MAG: hypothetical protein L3J29_01690 [Cyclobacteriaceae bacterium]|nr:hypothetical protein [Cyclobacteriaceae bacterium]